METYRLSFRGVPGRRTYRLEYAQLGYFYMRSEPRLDIDGKPVIDACGKPDEHTFECYRLTIAGDPYTEVSGMVDDQIRERFAAQYQAWKRGEEYLAGMRLADWIRP
jgi:hypothetical protein